MTKKLLAALLALMTTLCACAGHAEHTRDEVRAAYRAISNWRGGSPYLVQPAVRAPYDAGALSPAATADALDYLNFIRWLAGLEPVTESAIYDYQCQHGAVLLAALDYVDHNAPMPDDMDRNFYDSAHIGTSSGNVAKFNWMRDSIIREGVAYFVRDDGDQNLPVLGHRRWLLNPTMAATGFGLANAASGMSYVVMYAHDLGSPDADWRAVAWPSAGAFPAELMHDHLAWSLTLNPACCDLAASSPVVTLREDASGLSFEFRPAEGIGDGFCAMNFEAYGPGACVIFRPDFSGTDFTDYQQNQHWQVRVDGLLAPDGTAFSIEYETRMISLHIEDPVNVEISTLEAELAVGETFALSAQVIPVYADDIGVRWTSTNVGVASVDADGLVTAVGEGTCEIVAEDARGHRDACAITVIEK